MNIFNITGRWTGSTIKPVITKIKALCYDQSQWDGYKDIVLYDYKSKSFGEPIYNEDHTWVYHVTNYMLDATGGLSAGGSGSGGSGGSGGTGGTFVGWSTYFNLQNTKIEVTYWDGFEPITLISQIDFKSAKFTDLLYADYFSANKYLTVTSGSQSTINVEYTFDPASHIAGNTIVAYVLWNKLESNESGIVEKKILMDQHSSETEVKTFTFSIPLVDGADTMNIYMMQYNENRDIKPEFPTDADTISATCSTWFYSDLKVLTWVSEEVLNNRLIDAVYDPYRVAGVGSADISNGMESWEGYIIHDTPLRNQNLIGDNTTKYLNTTRLADYTDSIAPVVYDRLFTNSSNGPDAIIARSLQGQSINIKVGKSCGELQSMLNGRVLDGTATFGYEKIVVSPPISEVWWSRFAVYLTRDNKVGVECNYKRNFGTESWTNIVDIAVGYDWIAGLDNNGVVHIARDSGKGINVPDSELVFSGIPESRKLVSIYSVAMNPSNQEDPVSKYFILAGIDSDGRVWISGTSDSSASLRNSISSWPMTGFIDLKATTGKSNNGYYDGRYLFGITNVYDGSSKQIYCSDSSIDSNLSADRWNGIIGLGACGSELVGLRYDGMIVSLF